jgi:hypothetical protein
VRALLVAVAVALGAAAPAHAGSIVYSHARRVTARAR